MYLSTAGWATGANFGVENEDVGDSDEPEDAAEEAANDESLGAGENDCVCVPLLPPHAPSTVTAAKTVAIIIAGRGRPTGISPSNRLNGDRLLQLGYQMSTRQAATRRGANTSLLACTPLPALVSAPAICDPFIHRLLHGLPLEPRFTTNRHP